MKTKLFTLLAALVCATTAWAQTTVSTDSELRSAITDGANITVTADIDLSNSTLSIESGTMVTIDLGGYTLDRKLTKRGEGGGQVITVRKGATLNLSNGTLKGGWGRDGGGLVNEEGTVTLTNVNITGNTADDRGGGISNHGTLTMTGGSITGNTTNDQTDPKGGGGIMNTEGATATLTNVTITGNTVNVTGGGGICNYGTMTLDGCTITGNSCKMNGGGIWTAANATLNMQGAITVTGNTTDGEVANNLFLKTNAVVTITGSLEGSTMGVNMEANTGSFTSGYNTHNSGVDPATVFKADIEGVMNVSLNDAGNEAQLVNELPEGSVYYVERSWDADNFKVKATVMTVNDAVVLSNSGAITLTKKLYVVKDNITITGRILIKPEDNESVGIILCDGVKLKSNYDIVFDESTTKAKLHIYGQMNNSGKLDMSDNAGTSAFVRIGNTYYDGHDTEGEINIHGGDLDVNGNNMCPAIGAYSISSDLYDFTEETKYFIAKSGVINIYGGTVRAYGGESAAGIGSGLMTDDYGTINIYGGHITAAGRCPDILSKYSGGAGIGGGHFCGGGTLNIYGGDITAIGADEAAGIGCGQGSNYASGSSYSPGNINIYGGTVVAQGGVHGAGIGGGDGTSGTCNIKISGGHVIGKGGTDAAGIGGGEGGPGGNITISGGYVEAYGNDYGAGIGGGQDGAGGTISITGGTVIAKAGRNETGWRAFGPGSGSDAYGSLTIGDGLMVLSGDGTEGPYEASSRRDHCWFRTQARIEPCAHSGASYTIIDGNSHSVACAYCTTTATVQPHNFGSYGECDCHLISLADEGENSALFTRWADGNVHDFFLSGRKLEASLPAPNGDGSGAGSRAYTVCLPFDMDLSGRDDLMLYTLSYIKDGSEMIFTQTAKKIEAGKPYLIVIHEGELELLGSGKLITTADEGVRVYDWENREQPLGWWRGTLTKIESADAAEMMAYALQSVGDFRRIRPDTPQAWWGAFRSMYCPDELPATNRLTINKGTFGGFGGQIVNVTFEGDAEIDGTGIRSIDNGQWIIDNCWYNLSGQRLSKPQKGINIVNGNKIIIK